jgi:hypothetical protein
MLVELVGLVSAFNCVFACIQFVSDPYAMYETARCLRTVTEAIECVPIVEEYDGWNMVDEWDLVEKKNLFWG